MVGPPPHVYSGSVHNQAGHSVSVDVHYIQQLDDGSKLEEVKSFELQSGEHHMLEQITRSEGKEILWLWLPEIGRNKLNSANFTFCCFILPICHIHIGSLHTVVTVHRFLLPEYVYSLIKQCTVRYPQRWKHSSCTVNKFVSNQVCETAHSCDAVQ